MNRWPRVPATVTRCKLIEKTNREVTDVASYTYSTWQVKVVYVYEVDGKRCYGEKRIWPKVRTTAEAERLCGHYEREPEVEVRVNPDDPTDRVGGVVMFQDDRR